jgi:hypothetical protein
MSSLYFSAILLIWLDVLAGVISTACTGFRANLRAPYWERKHTSQHIKPNQKDSTEIKRGHSDELTGP